MASFTFPKPCRPAEKCCKLAAPPWAVPFIQFLVLDRAGKAAVPSSLPQSAQPGRPLFHEERDASGVPATIASR
jgi:hypothetical protein